MALQPHFNNITWVMDGEAQNFCFNNPHYPLCDHVRNFYQYRIDLVPNAVFLGIFAASGIGYIVTWIITRRATAFNIALLLGILLEVLGYAGRIMSWKNQWDENGFLMQICCLTIGPAFMAASLYLCLRRIVSAFGAENSRLPPPYYTRIFIPCDVVSLILQAVGGAMASIASHQHKSVTTGDNIMIAGLSFQVLTLLIFIITSIDFALRVMRRQRMMGSSAFDQNPALVRLRGSMRFKLFLIALSTATLCILWRSAFRVAELSKGWTGPVMGNQGMFIGFEGVLVAVAVLVLNFAHPAWCIPELFEGGGGLSGVWFFRGKKGAAASAKSLSDGESKVQTPPSSEA